MTSSAERSKRRKESNMAKAKAKFLDTQATLPEERRLGADRDWDEVVWRELSEAREAAFVSMRETFLDFLTDKELPMKLSPEDAESYFKKRGTPITTRVLRMFLEYLVQSRTGKISGAGGKVKYNTVHGYIVTLGVVFKRAQNPVEKIVKDAAHAWVEGHFVPNSMVTTLTKEKHTCFDVSMLVRELFRPEYISTFSNTRAPFQLAMFLILAVDCSGRVGEFVASNSKKTQTTYLKWRHATFTAFRTPTGITLRGTLRFNNLKSPTFEPDKKKTIPLRLLPLELALEDSFRMLIILGLIDKVFEGLTSWGDIQKLNPGPNGTRVMIKQSALDLPIFRAVKEHQVTELPLLYGFIWRGVLRLGRQLGLEHRLVCGALRRGAAYLLAMNCTKEERCARMGHKEGDGIYWNHYRNETSTVDFQAIVHSTEAEDVRSMSDIATNRRADAPRRPSQAAYRQMWQLPHIAALRDAQLSIFDRLLSRHGSMRIAREVQDPDVKSYDKASQNYSAACTQSLEVIFRREVKDFFATDCPKVDGEPQNIMSSTIDFDSVPIAIAAVDEDEEDEEDLTTQNEALSTAVNKDTEQFHAQPSESTDTATQGATAENFGKFLDDGAASEIDGDDLDEVQEPHENLVRIKQAGAGKTICRPITLVDAVSDALLSETPTLSDTELADLMMISFNHTFAADQFYPGQEPNPGSSRCRFCDKEFKKLYGIDPSAHAHFCQKLALAKSILQDLDQRFPATEKCTWIGRNKKKGQKEAQECGKTESDFKTKTQWILHLANHTSVTGNLPANECRFGDCGRSTDMVKFGSGASFSRHTMIHHHIRLSRAKDAEKVVDCMLWWCPLCFKWMNHLKEDVDHHARSHIQTVDRLIQAAGYAGERIGHLSVLPSFCVFCLHDSSKPETVRFNNWLGSEHHAEHIYDHIKDYDPDGRPYCPAWFKTDDGISSNCSALPMSPSDLAKHLEDAHDLKSKQRKHAPGKKKAVEEKEEDEDGSPQPETKKTKTSRRYALEPKSTNNVMRQMARKGSSASSSKQ